MFTAINLPQTRRVGPLESDFYMLIVPNPQHGENYRDFYIVGDSVGYCCFCFGCEIDSDSEAFEIAAANFADYLPDESEI